MVPYARRAVATVLRRHRVACALRPSSLEARSNLAPMQHLCRPYARP